MSIRLFLFFIFYLPFDSKSFLFQLAKGLFFNAIFSILFNGQRLSLLEEALCKANSSDPAIISSIIDEYSQQPSLKEQSAYRRLVFYLQLYWSIDYLMLFIFRSCLLSLSLS